VLLDRNNACKIGDFGLARKGGTGVEELLEEKTPNTGAPVYMAPELMSDSRSTEYDGSLVDVYSFGILMWAVLTRTKPYAAVSDKRNLNLWALVGLLLFLLLPPSSPSPSP
jgi:serine/threonine protein kinase